MWHGSYLLLCCFLCRSQIETCRRLRQMQCQDFTLLLLSFLKHHSKNSVLGHRSREHYCSPFFIYILWWWWCVWMYACLYLYVSMSNCACMCVSPQRYFNFFRILNKHAAASAKLCLPVGFGLDGRWWRGGRGGFVAVALGGWGNSWSGPPPDTLAPRTGGLLNHHTPPPIPASSGSRLQLSAKNTSFSAFCLSFFPSDCLSLQFADLNPDSSYFCLFFASFQLVQFFHPKDLVFLCSTPHSLNYIWLVSSH